MAIDTDRALKTLFAFLSLCGGATSALAQEAKAEEAAQTPAPDPEHMGDAARGAAWRWVDGWGEQDGKQIGSTHGCMAVDSEGRVYAATNVGVEVFSPTGDLLGVLPVQWGAENDRIRKPQNVAFGGADRRTLYIVGSATVYKVRTLSQGPDRPTK